MDKYLWTVHQSACSPSLFGMMGSHPGPFLKVFFTFQTHTTQPSHVRNWMFSFCTFNTRPASSYYTQTVVSITRSVCTWDPLLTHHTEHLQYVCSVTDGKPCCTNDVFLCCFPRYNQMNSMTIWFFLNGENWHTLTVNSYTYLFFFFLIRSLCVGNCLRFLL